MYLTKIALVYIDRLLQTHDNVLVYNQKSVGVLFAPTPRKILIG